ncbi:MAG TPA: hydrogenase iron-sulfur subunit [Caldisericia bacterium]|nr:hydrogenase iron-sulfur subunit [Caldisericia bacterium]
MQDNWEPKIIAFVCNWCTYAGADLAGTSRFKYAHNVKVIKTPCTGRIDPMFIVHTFEKGADGVMISGCHPNDCHYNEGNFNARRKYIMMRALLTQLGVDMERITFSWCSASEGIKFASLVNEVTEKIKKLGPYKDFTQLNQDER